VLFLRDTATNLDGVPDDFRQALQNLNRYAHLGVWPLPWQSYLRSVVSTLDELGRSVDELRKHSKLRRTLRIKEDADAIQKFKDQINQALGDFGVCWFRSLTLTLRTDNTRF
jgi:hypothetical protein